MEIGQRVRIIEGATPWMQKRGFWSGIEVETIDGMVGVVYQDYTHLGASQMTHLGGDFSHYSIKIDGLPMEVGVHPQWLIPMAD